MIEIDEAINLCNKMLEDVYLEPFKSTKISGTDNGSNGWHVGKRELIILLAKIYNKDPYDIKIKI